MSTDYVPPPERLDVNIAKRAWAGPHPEAVHWPNVFVQMLHGDWLSVCKCGVIHIGPDEGQVRAEADAHMPLFAAWKEYGY